MFIDTPANISLPQDIGNRTKKKGEEEQVKPVEEPDGGYKPELDLNKEEVFKNTVPKEMTTCSQEVGDIYGAEGRLIKEHNFERNFPDNGQSIDIIV